MSLFSYVALDSQGQKLRGQMEVGSQAEAVTRLKEMGLYPTRVHSVPKPRRTESRSLGRAGQRGGRWRLDLPFIGIRVRPAHLAVFTRQLATLMDAGMPIVRGLMLLREQEEHPGLRRIVGGLADTIEGGGTLTEGLRQHPRVFTELYVSMVKAGETAGVLEIVLNRLAEFLEKADAIKRRVMGALFYPVAVITVAVGILSLLMLFVVPRFQEVFVDLLDGGELPQLTQAVLNTSTFMKDHFLLAVGACFTGVALLGLIRRHPAGRRLFDRLKLAAPVLGPVIRKLVVARFSRTLATLMGSGVPILQALAIVRETAGNAVVAEAVRRISSEVAEGESIASPMKASGAFPGLVVGMVDIGEQSGALPEMLSRVADCYDQQADTAISSMLSLLEPVLIVLLAVVVGLIVGALFLPIIKIMENL